MADFVVTESYDPDYVRIISARDPISLQANAARKAAFRANLTRAILAGTTGVFLGDVVVTIEWYVSQQVRYSTHIVADLDNIIKPLLDAATGPDGVMIDDNQVQSIRISWQGPHDSTEKFVMSLDAGSPGEYLAAKDLFFIQFSPERCIPVPGEIPLDVVRLAVQAVNDTLQTHDRLVAMSADHAAEYVLPIQRFFPRSRLGRYVVRAASEFL